MSRLKLFIPLFLFVVLAGFLLRSLQLDPREMPSALIDRPLPDFQLSRLGADATVQRTDVIGEVAFFNVWATWCISCRVEHPYLQKLTDQGVVIYGVNYKDETVAALQWLDGLGDPYRLNIEDRDGTLGLDLGVFGAPETFLVDAQGVIRYRHVGIINDRVWREILQPLYRELRNEVAASL